MLRCNHAAPGNAPCSGLSAGKGQLVICAPCSHGGAATRNHPANASAPLLLGSGEITHQLAPPCEAKFAASPQRKLRRLHAGRIGFAKNPKALRANPLRKTSGNRARRPAHAACRRDRRAYCGTRSHLFRNSRRAGCAWPRGRFSARVRASTLSRVQRA